jgi:hypothetical protein
VRALVLFGVVVGALVALLWARPAMVMGAAPPRLAFQTFRLPIVGSGKAEQVTSDPSHKTQPAWSPDGARLASTAWSYEAVFFAMR